MEFNPWSDSTASLKPAHSNASSQKPGIMRLLLIISSHLPSPTNYTPKYHIISTSTAFTQSNNLHLPSPYYVPDTILSKNMFFPSYIPQTLCNEEPKEKRGYIVSDRTRFKPKQGELRSLST